MERNPNFQLILWIVIYSNMKAAFSILTACLIMASAQAANAEDITIGDKTYNIEKLIERKIGPDTVYTRLRLPDYPLNVNLVTVDLTVLVDKQPAHVEYYNISGVKCRKPDTPGIYIRHEGNKTDKIIVN